MPYQECLKLIHEQSMSMSIATQDRMRRDIGFGRKYEFTGSTMGTRRHGNPVGMDLAVVLYADRERIEGNRMQSTTRGALLLEGIGMQFVYGQGCSLRNGVVLAEPPNRGTGRCILVGVKAKAIAIGEIDRRRALPAVAGDVGG